MPQRHRIALIVTTLAFAGAAHATNVFRLEGYGAASRGMGGTSAAYDTGSAALVSNPATLGLTETDQRIDVGLDLVTTSDLKITNTNTGESVSSKHDTVTSAYYAPQGGYVRKSGNLTWAVGAYAGGGLGTNYGKSSFLSRTPFGTNTGLENSSRLLVLQIPAGLSYDVNDRLSVGAALDAVWTGLNLNLLLGADQVVNLIGQGRARGPLKDTLLALNGLYGLEGAHFSLSKSNDVQSGVEAWGWGGRLGLTYKISDRTRMGVSYSLKTHLQDLKGRATLTAVTTTAGQIPLTGNIKIADFQMPSTLTIGFAHQVNDDLMVAADVSQVGWKEVMKDIKVRYTADNGQDLAIELPQNYKDVTILSLGGAYKMGQWTLRAGGSVSNQAIPNNMLFAVIPATPTKHLSLGASYQIDKTSAVHLAYSHALQQTLSNSSLPNTSAPIRSEHTQDNFVVGYSYSF